MVNGLREVSVSLDGCWAPQPACPQGKKTYNNRNVSNKLYRLEVSLVVDSFKEIARET